MQDPSPAQAESYAKYRQLETLALPGRGSRPGPHPVVLEVGLYRGLLTSDRILGPVPAAQTALWRSSQAAALTTSRGQAPLAFS